jgi:hypothetical protein
MLVFLVGCEGIHFSLPIGNNKRMDDLEGLWRWLKEFAKRRHENRRADLQQLGELLNAAEKVWKQYMFGSLTRECIERQIIFLIVPLMHELGSRFTAEILPTRFWHSLARTAINECRREQKAAKSRTFIDER